MVMAICVWEILNLNLGPAPEGFGEESEYRIKQEHNERNAWMTGLSTLSCSGARINRNHCCQPFFIEMLGFEERNLLPWSLAVRFPVNCAGFWRENVGAWLQFCIVFWWFCLFPWARLFFVNLLPSLSSEITTNALKIFFLSQSRMTVGMCPFHGGLVSFHLCSGTMQLHDNDGRLRDSRHSSRREMCCNNNCQLNSWLVYGRAFRLCSVSKFRFFNLNPLTKSRTHPQTKGNVEHQPEAGNPVITSSSGVKAVLDCSLNSLGFPLHRTHPIVDETKGHWNLIKLFCHKGSGYKEKQMCF